MNNIDLSLDCIRNSKEFSSDLIENLQKTIQRSLAESYAKGLAFAYSHPKCPWIKVKNKFPESHYLGLPDKEKQNCSNLQIYLVYNDKWGYFAAFVAQCFHYEKMPDGSKELKMTYHEDGTPVWGWFSDYYTWIEIVDEDDVYFPIPSLPDGKIWDKTIC